MHERHEPAIRALKMLYLARQIGVGQQLIEGLPSVRSHMCSKHVAEPLLDFSRQLKVCAAPELFLYVMDSVVAVTEIIKDLVPTRFRSPPLDGVAYESFKAFCTVV